MFIVRLIDANGIHRFYTGRAGCYFLSANRADAFTYSTMQGARHRADIFNRTIGTPTVPWAAIEA
jgi:hypothetical protein